jgi:hypothetical protein
VYESLRGITLKQVLIQHAKPASLLMTSKGVSWGSLLMVTNTYFDHQHSTQNQGKTTSQVSFYVYNLPSSTCTWKNYLYAGIFIKMNKRHA